MRIKITKGGLYGAKGPIPIGTEMKVKAVPANWAGRYVDLDAQSKEPDDELAAARAEIDTLKARIAELEGEQGSPENKTPVTNPADGALPAQGLTVTDKSGGWYVITDGDKEVTKSLRKADVEGFDKLSDADKAKFVEANKAE